MAALVDSITYGNGIPGESELRLLGDVSGKRVLELGCPFPANPVANARRGAKSIVVDPSAEALAAARSLAEVAEVRLETHRAELWELGFATSGSIDVVLAAGSLAAADDVERVFRQVHRVLRPHGTLVVALPHPLSLMLDGGEVVLRRPYWSAGRTVSGVFAALGRAGFQVDVMLEPEPLDAAAPLVPPLLVIRGRKLGI